MRKFQWYFNKIPLNGTLLARQAAKAGATRGTESLRYLYCESTKFGRLSAEQLYQLYIASVKYEVKPCTTEPALQSYGRKAYSGGGKESETDSIVSTQLNWRACLNLEHTIGDKKRLPTQLLFQTDYFR